MVDLLTPDEIGELKEIFIQHDTNGDGCIATTELGTVLHAMKIFVSEADLQNYILDIDPDGYGLIDFCELLSLIVRKVRCPDPDEDLLEAFKVYDRDGNGYITANELQDVLTKLGEEVTVSEVKAIIDEADTDGDGMINYADFARVMTEKSN